MLAKKIRKQHKKKEFFEVYRVLWVLEFVETDLEDQHLRIKIFYIYKVHPPVVIWGVWFLLLPGFVSASTREKHLPSLFSSASCTLNFTVGATSSSQPMSLNTQHPLQSPPSCRRGSEQRTEQGWTLMLPLWQCWTPETFPASSQHGSRLKKGSKTYHRAVGSSQAWAVPWCYLYGALQLLQDLSAPVAATATTHSRSQQGGTGHRGLKISPRQSFSFQIINSQYDSRKLSAVTVPTVGWGFSFCASYSPKPLVTQI